jgi:hypothetical protein
MVWGSDAVIPILGTIAKQERVRISERVVPVSVKPEYKEPRVANRLGAQE